jgi:hypothetical protein
VAADFEALPAFAIFYVVRTVHFGPKLYNDDQGNAQVFDSFIYLLLRSSVSV